MEFAFDNKELRAVCENRRKAETKFGAKVAQVLFDRLADVRAADSISDLFVGNPTVFDDLEGMHGLRIELTNNYVITFTPNHVEFPRDNKGHINWKTVTRLKIIKIEMLSK